MATTAVDRLVLLGRREQKLDARRAVRRGERHILEETCFELRNVGFLAAFEAKLAIEGLRLLGRAGTCQREHRAMPQLQVVRVLREALAGGVVGAEKFAIPLCGLNHSHPFARAVLRVRRHAQRVTHPAGGVRPGWSTPHVLQVRAFSSA